MRYHGFALNITDDLWSRARGSAGDYYKFHPEEFGDPRHMRGKLTAYELRHGEQYTGLDLPFECLVKFRMLDPMQKSKHKCVTCQRKMECSLVATSSVAASGIGTI